VYRGWKRIRLLPFIDLRAGSRRAQHVVVVAVSLALLLAPALVLAADPVAVSDGARSDSVSDTSARAPATLEELLASTMSDLAAVAASDADGDGVPTGVEAALGLDPTRQDTDRDGILDGDEDPDGDRLTVLFELDESRTDPGRADSDRDGLRDGVEDPDGDGLSNAGEQKYGTDPYRRDTDRDGRSDWREDADHDGRPNGLEQDSRRLPANLTPSLRAAPADVPVSSAPECHSRKGKSSPGSCSFGPRNGKLVLLIGDSHAVQWFPAIRRVAQDRGWRLVTMTKAACPIADVRSIRDGKRDTACSRWRTRAFAKAKRLKPALVIVANIGTTPFVGGTRRSTDARTSRLWRDGLVRSYRRLRRISTTRTVVVLGDTQRWSRHLYACLADHPGSVGTCAPRDDDPVTIHWERVTRKAAKAAKVDFETTRKLACPYDPCPLVVDRYFVSRDGGHLTATYSAQLWRGMARRLPDP
jgi:SGNH domain (fused to AT3 domains)